jgi:hypothetical protein
MNEADFENWLKRYGEAWETRDADKLVPLFTDDVLYYETPFDEAMHGSDAIRAYWSVLPMTQDHIHFHYRIVSVQPEQSVAQWWASFIRLPTKMHVKIDGVMICEFDENNRCRYFREWWHRHEVEDTGV